VSSSSLSSPAQHLVKDDQFKQHPWQCLHNDSLCARRAPACATSTSRFSFVSCWLEFLLSPITVPGVLTFLQPSLLACRSLAFAAVIFAVRFLRKKPNPTDAVLLISRALTASDAVQESVPHQCANRAHGISSVWGRVEWHVLDLEERRHSARTANKHLGILRARVEKTVEIIH
jgi:hypothetical protein